MRIEKDTMGEMNLPDDSYYGAQTQRAFQNFQISSLKMPRPMIAAMALIKRSAAVVNYKLGSLDSNIKDHIWYSINSPDNIAKSPINALARYSRAWIQLILNIDKYLIKRQYT